MQEPEAGGRIQGKCIFLDTQQGSCIYERTVLLTAYTRTAQAQAKQNPSVKGKVSAKPHLQQRNFWQQIAVERRASFNGAG